VTWYPSSEDVMKLHFELVELFAKDENPISPPGARDPGLVESACGRARHSGTPRSIGPSKRRAQPCFIPWSRIIRFTTEISAQHLRP